MDEVVKALADLTFFETMVEAASFCLVTAMRAVPALAGLALVRDEAVGSLVVVHAKGPRSYEVVRSRVADDDPVLSAAIMHGGPMALQYGPAFPPPERHAIFGDPWTAFVAPARAGSGKGCLAAIELIDPIDSTLADVPCRLLATITRHLVERARGLPHTVGNVFAPEQVGLED